MIKIVAKEDSVLTELKGTGEQIINELIKCASSVLLKMSDDDEDVYDVIVEDFITNFKDFSSKVKETNFNATKLKS